jgi:hypothetical protein
VIIAILEDDDRRQQAMREHLGRRFPACEPAFFDNAPDMLNWLQTHLAEVALVCLDHDLGPNRTRAGQVFDPGNGRDVANYLAACAPRCPIIVHTSNPEAAPGMLWELESAGWTVRRVIPFDDLQWVESSWAERVAECLSRGTGA